MSDRINIGGVELDVRADGSLLIADLQKAEAQTQRFANKAQGDLNKVKRDGFDPIGRAIGDIKSQLIALASVGALVGLTREAVKAADAFSGMRSRLSLVVQEGENLLTIEEQLTQMAFRNRAALEPTVALYSKLRSARSDLTDAKTQQLVETWNRTLVISGANAQGAAASTMQFSQAMSSGVLRAEEFNSIVENNSRAVKLFADSMGVGVGELRQLVNTGKVGFNEILKALTEDAGSVNAEFGRMKMTVAQAGTNFETAFTRVVGLLDQSSGASATLAKWIDNMASSLIDLGVALGGPIAEAQSLMQKIGEAQTQIIDDGDKLKQLYIDMAGAIAMGGEEAGDAARLEIDAITQRIKANKDLIEVYSNLAEAKMIVAEGELSVRKGDPSRALYSDRGIDGRGGLDDLLSSVPLNSAGDTIGKVFGTFPAQQIGREGDINQRFGTREQRLQAALDQIHNTDPSKLSAAQRALVEYNQKTLELEVKAKSARLEFEALNKAIAEGTKYVPPGATPDKPPGKTPSGTTSTKKSEFAFYASALEEMEKTIARIRDSDLLPYEKSRATQQALLDYIDATKDIETAQKKIVSVGDLLAGDSGGWGVVHAHLQQVAREIREAEQEAIPSLAETVSKLGFKPGDRVVSTTKAEAYVDPFEEDLRDATKRALFDAARDGDYGDMLEQIIGDAAGDGLSRAVDRLVDALFSLDWEGFFNQVTSGGGGGGDIWHNIGNAVSALFGGSKAGGGDMVAGRAYRVGELGPEMFIPKVDGTLVPSRTGALVNGGMMGGGGVGISIGGPVVTINGNLDGVTLAQLQQALADHRRMLPAAIDARVINRLGKGAY